MTHDTPPTFALEAVPESPCYVVDTCRLERNLEVLTHVQAQSGCKILLALKGFAMWSVFPQVARHLAGVTASSPWEARLGREKWNAEVHAYAPAYSDADIDELVTLTDHIVLNSVTQWQRHVPRIRAAGRQIECGLRLNPEQSEVEVELYDPCAPSSRLGVRRSELDDALVDDLDGVHVHALCESDAASLSRVAHALEAKFPALLTRSRWVNLGGGHHVTRPGYDIASCIETLAGMAERHRVQVYIEPGEAIALDTGWLVATVLDILPRDPAVAILDTSATAHMPDVLEMPYRPRLSGTGRGGERRHTYVLGGLTCLAGDVIGTYSFDKPLAVGDRLAFQDMAHYSMVKNTTFNGVRLPSIATYDPQTTAFRVVRRFGYADYRDRLS